MDCAITTKTFSCQEEYSKIQKTVELEAAIEYNNKTRGFIKSLVEPKLEVHYGRSV